MRIDRLELRNFRNYADQTAEFHPDRNILTGENAQGKTNLLEALAMLSRGKSPRSRTDRELVRFGERDAAVAGGVRSRERDFRVEIGLFTDRRRSVRINHVGAKNGDLSGVLKTVLFQPEDLQLVREGAAVRRRFLDTALCQLRPAYAEALSRYNRALQQKTRILRDSGDFPGLLDALPEFNEQLIRYGAVLVRYRARFTARLEEAAAAHHRECSGGREALSVRYRTADTIADPAASVEAAASGLRAHLAAHAAAERAARQCLSGPHKDDLEVSVNGRAAKTYASQGQARTAALALKLAERDLYRNAAGEAPVLLLDDVLSELDPRRQEFVLNRVGGGQVFVTCCEDDRLASLLGGKVLRVRDGALEE